MSASASITDYLTHDHHGIDELFEEAQHKMEAGQAALAREPFEKFAARLGRHIRLEEEVVFPLFEARTRIAGPAQVMRREHRLLEAHLEQARYAIESGDLARFVAAAAPLCALIAEHNMKEERIVYPKTDQALGDERVRLAAELEEA